MHPNEQLLERFYAAFAERDHATMQACYSPDVRFKDGAFEVSGKRAHAMWHMLCENSTDLRVTSSDYVANDRAGSAKWEAKYTLSATGRPVHNIIESVFTFKDGLIDSHLDTFNMWRWSRQALGPVGLLLGWSPMVKAKVQAMAAKGLDAFIAQHPEYSPQP